MIPKITVITVVFNGYEVLEKTIISVINQVYNNIEYLIIDGGSNDGTLDIIKKYENSIQYWTSEKDKGIYDAMNKGLEKANGDWILFLNAGDCFVSDNVLKNSSVYLKDKNLNYYGIAEIFFGKKLLYQKPKSEKINFYKDLPIHQTVFISSKYKEYKFDPNLKIVADSIYLFNLSIISNFEFIPVPIARFHLGGVSSWYNSYKQFRIHLNEHLSFIEFKKGGLKEKAYVCFAFSTKYFLSLFFSKNLYFKIVGNVSRIK